VKESFLSFVKKQALLTPGDRVLVALSGGADSTCLLHLLAQMDFEVAAAHLHHSQRPEGDADVEHCRRLCESLGVAFFAGKADVPAVAKLHKIGLEEAGRKLRYEFLQMVAANGYDKIATGHTANDGLESMLISLARGAGMKGLAGIPTKRDNVIRPILFMQRSETEEYCRANGLGYLQDSYNEDESFARNLVRKRVVPVLERVNSETVAHAGTTAKILAEENVLLDTLAGAHLAANEIPRTGPLAFLENRIATEWRPMADLPIALVRRCLRIAASMYGGSLDYAATQSLAEAIHRGEKASYTAEGGSVAVTTGADKWTVTVVDRPEPFRQVLTLPGETIADDLGWSLAAWEGRADNGPLNGQVNSYKLKGSLFARSIKPGDEISPPGRCTGRRLAERLSRAGVRQAVRERLPIVCDMVGPVWAPLVGTDVRCCVRKSTDKVIALSLGPIKETLGNSPAV
jgi:tRNA(Ile)-lysidine synthase